VLTIVQNFTPVGPRISEISRSEKKIKNKKTSGLKLKSAPQAIAFGRTNKCILFITSFVFILFDSIQQLTTITHKILKLNEFGYVEFFCILNKTSFLKLDCSCVIMLCIEMLHHLLQQQM